MLFGQLVAPISSTVSGFASSAAANLLGGFGGTASSNGSLPNNFLDPRARPEYMVWIMKSGTNPSPTSSDRPITVCGYLPEEFDFNLQSHWEAPFSDFRLSQLANMVMQMMGRKFATQGMSSQFWTGSEHVSFSMRLVFVAENGPNDLLQPIFDLYSLVLPSKDQHGFFKAPGPKLVLGQQLSAALNQASTDVRSSVNNLLNETSSAAGNVASQTFGNAANTTAGGLSGVIQKASNATTAIINTIKKGFEFEGQINLQIGQFLYIRDVILKDVSNLFKVVMTTDGIPMSVEVTVTFETHQIPTVEDVAGWLLVQPNSITQQAPSMQLGSSFNAPAIPVIP